MYSKAICSFFIIFSFIFVGGHNSFAEGTFSITDYWSQDRDGDGVADWLDRCPDLIGEARYSGCPFDLDANTNVDMPWENALEYAKPGFNYDPAINVYLPPDNGTPLDMVGDDPSVNIPLPGIAPDDFENGVERGDWEPAGTGSGSGSGAMEGTLTGVERPEVNIDTTCLVETWMTEDLEVKINSILDDAVATGEDMGLVLDGIVEMLEEAGFPECVIVIIVGDIKEKISAAAESASSSVEKAAEEVVAGNNNNENPVENVVKEIAEIVEDGGNLPPEELKEKLVEFLAENNVDEARAEELAEQVIIEEELRKEALNNHPIFIDYVLAKEIQGEEGDDSAMQGSGWGCSFTGGASFSWSGILYFGYLLFSLILLRRKK